jgi:hypothetical protein
MILDGPDWNERFRALRLLREFWAQFDFHNHNLRIADLEGNDIDHRRRGSI